MIPYDSQLKPQSNISGLVENRKQIILVSSLLTESLNVHKPKHNETWNTVTAMTASNKLPLIWLWREGSISQSHGSLAPIGNACLEFCSWYYL